MKLRARALGLAVGILSGVLLFAMTVIDIQFGKGQTLGLLGVFFPGYGISIRGAFLALFWGFVYGFVGGALIALLYNAFHKMLYKKEGSVA